MLSQTAALTSTIVSAENAHVAAEWIKHIASSGSALFTGANEAAWVVLVYLTLLRMWALVPTLSRALVAAGNWLARLHGAVPLIFNYARGFGKRAICWVLKAILNRLSK